jgi:hypothetical protein
MALSNIKINNEINRRRALEAWEELETVKSTAAKPTKSQIRKQRQYRLEVYPLIEARRIGAITKAEFDQRHREVLEELDKTYGTERTDAET